MATKPLTWACSAAPVSRWVRGMYYFPINLDLRGKRCVVVGGGEVAERRAEALLGCGADVLVVSPKVTTVLQELVERGEVRLAERPFAPADVQSAFLVMSATDSREVNAEVSRLARNVGILVSVADDAALSDFIMPATIRRNAFQISVCTSGKSPALAKRVRQELEDSYGEEYGLLVEILGEIREVVKAERADQGDRQAVFESILDSDVIDLLAAGKVAEAKSRAWDILEDAKSGLGNARGGQS